MLPQARSDDLTVEPIGDELLVFDAAERRAHSLNPAAADVWRACDGSRDAAAIAEHTGLDRDAVALALENLRDCRLLTGALSESTGPTVSRRDAIRKAALAGAALGAAIPVIRSITAPSVALASSCHGTPNSLNEYQACNSTCQCHAGSCCCHAGPPNFGVGCIRSSQCSTGFAGYCLP